ncbi:histidine phosphatase family protein [Micromonospora sp. NPDC049374]|uniref:histidine phosphatase family protein n=1 Tax=Micromonospora sp. NPDC049374 TaxID=3154352 RepID=UPI0034496067
MLVAEQRREGACQWLAHSCTSCATANRIRRPLTPPDGGLSQLGREQADRLGRRLRTVPFSAIHHSPLARAVQTADVVAGHLPQVPRHACDLVADHTPVPSAGQRGRYPGPWRWQGRGAPRTRERGCSPCRGDRCLDPCREHGTRRLVLRPAAEQHIMHHDQQALSPPRGGDGAGGGCRISRSSRIRASGPVRHGYGTASTRCRSHAGVTARSGAGARRTRTR